MYWQAAVCILTSYSCFVDHFLLDMLMCTDYSAVLLYPSLLAPCLDIEWLSCYLIASSLPRHSLLSYIHTSQLCLSVVRMISSCTHPQTCKIGNWTKDLLEDVHTRTCNHSYTCIQYYCSYYMVSKMSIRIHSTGLLNSLHCSWGIKGEISSHSRLFPSLGNSLLDGKENRVCQY